MKAVVAALVSGGLDSAVLVATLAHRSRRVLPITIRQGLRWEPAERYWLRQWLATFPQRLVAPLITLAEPTADLYPRHWSVTGVGIPDREDPDEAVGIPGRNLLLVAKAAVYCAMRNVPTVALGTLRGNPFADAQPPFWRALSRALTVGLGRRLRVITPLAALTKAQAIRRTPEWVPLGWTFSCLQPMGRRHCGRCQKCGERQRAFHEAGMADPTRYGAR